jgi:hypothetical protein
MEQTSDTTWLVQSSGGDAWYEVNLTTRECECLGFHSRHRCRHLTQVLDYTGRAPG